jgi:hypothetical protein
MTMGVANGKRLPCLGVCLTLSFSINDESFCIDFLIITLESYEVVLRCCALEPIWTSHASMAFWWLDRRVKLSPPTTSCTFFWRSSRMTPPTTAFTYYRLHRLSSSGLTGTHRCLRMRSRSNATTCSAKAASGLVHRRSPYQSFSAIKTRHGDFASTTVPLTPRL